MVTYEQVFALLNDGKPMEAYELIKKGKAEGTDLSSCDLPCAHAMLLMSPWKEINKLMPMMRIGLVELAGQGASAKRV